MIGEKNRIGHSSELLLKLAVQGPSNALHTCLDSGQCRTPPTHGLYSIHWGPGALGRALQAGLSTDCGLLHQRLGYTVTPNERRKGRKALSNTNRKI